MSMNYGLFDKHLSKISPLTISKFGSLESVTLFLTYLCESGNIAFAAKRFTDSSSLSPLELPKIIKQDKYLNKCVQLALQQAAESAEGVLYDRAINGYEELTYNKAGECVARKKKYCSKSLLEYLKANSIKYQPKANLKEKGQNNRKPPAVEVTNFEVESYDVK